MSIIRREKSRTGVYHVLVQGAGNNELFHDDEDYQVFVEYLARLMTNATTWEEFKGIPREEKLKTIKQLLQNGASIRQMEKLTGIGRGIIQNL